MSRHSRRVASSATTIVALMFVLNGATTVTFAAERHPTTQAVDTDAERHPTTQAVDTDAQRHPTAQGGAADRDRPPTAPGKDASKPSPPASHTTTPRAVVHPAPRATSRRASASAARGAATSHQTRSRAAARPTTSRPKAIAAKSRAYHRHSDASFPADFEATPAYRYAQLEPSACLAEIEKRNIAASPDQATWPGIKAPMRLGAPLNGVNFHTDIVEGEHGRSPYEIFDCRLLLALDDFTQLLRAETIVEAVLSSAYRPNPALGDEQGRRHAGGLAVDLHRFKLADGRWIKVEQDFHGHIGKPVCGAHAAKAEPATPDSTLLRRLVCGAAEKRLFQSILTPNYDRPHRNHFHLELTVGVKWFIVS